MARVLIIGLGSIGQRHLRNLGALGVKDILLCSRSFVPSGDAANLPVYRDLGAALAQRPDAAIISNVTVEHVPTALEAAKAGCHLMIEKPISHELAGLDELFDLCRNRRLVLMVGYNLRFHRPLVVLREAIRSGKVGRVVSMRAEVGQYLPDWRPGRDYRDTQSAHQSRGGGLILELSHEIDYPMWMLGDIGSVVAKAGKTGDLEIDTDDVAELIVTFAGGAIGSIHLDMVQRRPRRLCRIVGTEGALEWEASSDSVRLFSAADRTECDLWSGGPVDRNEMYLQELQHFLDCVAGRRQPLITGEDGRRVVKVALAAIASSRTGREEAV